MRNIFILPSALFDPLLKLFCFVKVDNYWLKLLFPFSQFRNIISYVAENHLRSINWIFSFQIRSLLVYINDWIVANISHTSQSKMEIFQVIQKRLGILNINPNESNPLNWKITMSFLMFGYSILSCVILIFIAEKITLMDFVISFCVISELIKMGICLAVIVAQRMKLFEVIGSIEKLINESNHDCNLFIFRFNWILTKRTTQLKEIKLIFFRIEICNVKGNLWRYKSTSWEDIEYFVFCPCKSNATMRNLAEICD